MNNLPPLQNGYANYAHVMRVNELPGCVTWREAYGKDRADFNRIKLLFPIFDKWTGLSHITQVRRPLSTRNTYIKEASLLFNLRGLVYL